MTRSNSLILLIFFSVIVAFLYIFKETVFPFISGILIAYAFSPVIDKVENKINRTVSSAIITLSFVSIFIFLLISIIPKIEKEIFGLMREFPIYSKKVLSAVNLLLERFGFQQYDTLEIQKLLMDKMDIIIGFLMKIFSHGNAITGFFSNMVIIPVTMFYMMRDWPKLVGCVFNCIPNTYRPILHDLSDRIRMCLWRFFQGQMCVAFILACYYSVCLSALSFSNAILLGTITGCMSFIPFIGAVLCGITAFLIGALNGFTITKLSIVAFVYTVGPLLESYVLTPRFVGGEVGLHPLWVLFAFFAGIQVYGIIGVAIAIPCASVLAEISKFAINMFRKQTCFKV